MHLNLLLFTEILTFCIVTLVAVGVMQAAFAYMNVRRRLGDEAETASAPTSDLVKSEFIHSAFLRWVQSVTSINDSKARGQLRQELFRAGIDHPAAPVLYVLIRFSLAIGLPAALVLSQPFMAKPLTGITAIIAPLILCGLGLIAPHMVVDNRTRARQEQLEQEFPDALDLLVVCVEAGLGTEAAFVRVGQEMAASHPRIGEEFGRLAHELAAGRSRAEALRAMAERSQVLTIKSFVALLIQTDTLGVSIGQTLRTYSVEMRERRFLKAEEKAMRIPALMTMPLVACILPVIIVALLLPGIIDVIRNFTPALHTMHH